MKHWLVIIAAFGMIGNRLPAGPAKKVKPTVPERVRKQIMSSIKDLGAKPFKTREAATKTLMRIGRGEMTNEKEPAKKAVLDAVNKTLAATKDPEVRSRARRVQKALQPPSAVVVGEEIEVVEDKDDGLVIEID